MQFWFLRVVLKYLTLPHFQWIYFLSLQCDSVLNCVHKTFTLTSMGGTTGHNSATMLLILW